MQIFSSALTMNSFQSSLRAAKDLPSMRCIEPKSCSPTLILISRVLCLLNFRCFWYPKTGWQLGCSDWKWTSLQLGRNGMGPFPVTFRSLEHSGRVCCTWLWTSGRVQHLMGILIDPFVRFEHGRSGTVFRLCITVLSFEKSSLFCMPKPVIQRWS